MHKRGANPSTHEVCKKRAKIKQGKYTKKITKTLSSMKYDRLKGVKWAKKWELEICQTLSSMNSVKLKGVKWVANEVHCKSSWDMPLVNLSLQNCNLKLFLFHLSYEQANWS